MKNNFLTLCWIVVAMSGALAQSVQSPAKFLGYELGEQFTYHHRVVDYFEHVAATSSQVRLIPYGATYERRPLMVMAVSSAENIAQLDQLRLQNLHNIGLSATAGNGRQVPIVWLSYNVHGDESVSTEAVMGVLHTLVTDAAVQAWLKEVIVVLDPCINPDGRDRYANWYNRVRQVPHQPDLDGMEHHQPWPGGRYNHYLFDLNRDWAWQSQVESQQRAVLYNQWMPHLHVDFHEQGINEPYFFAPAAEPLHEAITDWQHEFEGLVGRNNAKYFDKEGWLYFTNEVFDLLYPSYGDTWPTYNGAIGFTYEQGGSGRAGLGVIGENGNELTLKDRIAHHYTNSLSTIETAYQHRVRLIEEFNAYFTQTTKNGYGEYKSFVVKSHPQRAKTLATLMQLLDRQGISYYHPKSAAGTMRGFDYLNNKAGQSFALAADDLVIPTAQPKGRLAAILFEPKTAYHDSVTYDLTAWALPYAYQLEAYAVAENIPTKAYSATQAVDEVSGEMPYAYAIAWNDLAHAALLADMLKSEIKVRYASRPFKVGSTNFERGTLIVTRDDNQHYNGDFHKDLIAKCLQHNIAPQRLYSGMVTEGKDFGSDYVRFIHPPKVALIGGDGVTPTAYGEMWHYLERDLQYPITTIHSSYANGIDWSKYDVIILVSGYSYGIKTDELLDFVRNGGKVIALEGAIRQFGNGDRTELARSRDKEKDEKPSLADMLKTYGNQERDYLSSSVEGSIYRVTLDATHPLAFGYNSSVHLMKRNSAPLPLLQSGEWNVGVFGETAHVSGFVGYKTKAAMKNTLAFGVEHYGDGQLIYFADSPIFRQFWHSGKLLMANALFFVD